MTRVLKLRALCDSCERAEAVSWCVNSRRTLCESCPSKGARVPLPNGSIVSAMCAKCSKVPAAKLVNGKGVCSLCYKEGKPLRANAVIFDKMDFSHLGSSSRKHSSLANNHRWVAGNSTNVDLSYFKTPIPASVARNVRAAKSSASSRPKSRGNSGSNGGASASSNRRDHA